MKQEIIILEGLDMVGKTTIAQKLSEDIHVPLFKEIRNERWYDHVIDLLYAEESRIQMLEQVGFNIIFDRSFPSEYSYAHAHGRKTIDERIWELDERYAKLGTKIIYLYKPIISLEKDKTNLINRDDYKKVADWYEDFFKKTKCDTMFLDTSDHNLDNQITKIKKFIGV